MPFAAGECLMYPFHPQSEERTITQGPLVQYSYWVDAEVCGCWFFPAALGHAQRRLPIHPTKPQPPQNAQLVVSLLLHLLICIPDEFSSFMRLPGPVLAAMMLLLRPQRQEDKDVQIRSRSFCSITALTGPDSKLLCRLGALPVGNNGLF